ncbi:GNAT family N-acetyltransferase [Eudoraea adriatica]|uniref:GNAT family N-acetyltransferase n=1 Tax=Eudoraea adriatica TaxID=446681 RepID=UPI000381750F|nr:GNAT family N-acetyltransferase [Eudoraea adriatica]
MEIKIEEVSNKTCRLYCKLGTKAYKEHYLHLWQNNDPAPYIEKSFTIDVVKDELKDNSVSLWLIYHENTAVGILKLIKDAPIASHASKEVVLLEKIYILHKFSGKGIGSFALRWVETYCLKANRQLIWLETMQKGAALNFYLKNGYHIIREKKLKFDQVLEKQKPMYILYKKVKPQNSQVVFN